MQQPFQKNKLYRRSEIHDAYGGSRQSGISPSASYPYIFIFSGANGNRYGYRDAWENNHVFAYSGEGQSGDMSFTRGNLALRDHVQNGKRVFLFDYVQKGVVRFVEELVLHEADFFEMHDSQGNKRIGIKFFFFRAGATMYPVPEMGDSLAVVATGKNRDYYYRPPNETERQGLVTSRVGQGAYRKSILYRWEFKCAVTGFRNANILIASHIVPWKEATDVERLDVDNGILLSPTYDALFDKHLISFENNGKIVLSDKISRNELSKIGVNGKVRITNFSERNKEYLAFHREKLA